MHHKDASHGIPEHRGSDDMYSLCGPLALTVKALLQALNSQIRKSAIANPELCNFSQVQQIAE